MGKYSNSTSWKSVATYLALYCNSLWKLQFYILLQFLWISLLVKLHYIFLGGRRLFYCLKDIPQSLNTHSVPLSRSYGIYVSLYVGFIVGFYTFLPVSITPYPGRGGGGYPLVSYPGPVSMAMLVTSNNLFLFVAYSSLYSFFKHLAVFSILLGGLLLMRSIIPLIYLGKPLNSSTNSSMIYSILWSFKFPFI